MTTTTVPAGLDFESLRFTLEWIGDCARRELPDRLLIELDERGEFPEALVRRMCGEQHGEEAASASATLAQAARRRSP